MTRKNRDNKQGVREQLGILFHPKNIVKTVASVVPLGSVPVEMLNQLEGHQTSQKIGALEEKDLELEAKVHKLELSVGNFPSTAQEWPTAVAQYSRRIVDLAIAYDGGFRSRAERGRELVRAVAHGCFVGAGEVLTCREAIEFARDMAETKYGRVIILSGSAWYEFEPEAPDEFAGLAICRITGRDEKKWADERKLRERYEKRGVAHLLHEPITTRAKFSITPWLGQEVGFLHSGEATDVRRDDRFSGLQFDATAISHFRRPRDGAFKTFVTGVLPGRILRTGSPAFGRDGTLLGVIADTENYPSDAGRRAVVRSLLGHPLFMKSANGK